MSTGELDALSPEARREVEERLEGHLRTLQLITFGLFSGLLVITVGGSFALTTGFLDSPLAGLPEWVTWLVGLYVAACLLGAPFLQRTILEKETPEEGANALLQRHVRAVVIAMALREGAGLFGAVWSTLTGSIAWLLGLAVPALLTIVVAWPRRRDVHRLFREHAAEVAEG